MSPCNLCNGYSRYMCRGLWELGARESGITRNFTKETRMAMPGASLSEGRHAVTGAQHIMGDGSTVK